MRPDQAAPVCLLLSLATAGCATTPGANDAGGAPCADPASCAPPESVCLEHLAAYQADDGCGVFVSEYHGDDMYPGTREKPVRSLPYAIELARTGRGRVFPCDQWLSPITLPAGVDLLGSFNCFDDWKRKVPGSFTNLNSSENVPVLTVEPARSGDTGAADGISTIADMAIQGGSRYGVFVHANTAVEIIRGRIIARWGWSGHDGENLPNHRAADGAAGNDGADACTAALQLGAPAVTLRCEVGDASVGGKGGDGMPDQGGDGEDGTPFPVPPTTSVGIGGSGGHESPTCQHGQTGGNGNAGADGAPGEGIGRLDEAGWTGGKATDGAPGQPGQGGGGGGGGPGGRAWCGSALQGGAAGSSGGTGGCGGKGGGGGENGSPSVAIVALHAKVTVRDVLLITEGGGDGGDGGNPQRGGYGGVPGIGGGYPGRSDRACDGGRGGYGGPGGSGGGGRGGDSIGVAYVGDDPPVLEGVTFELGAAGKGGTNRYGAPSSWGADGAVHETLRFPD